MIFVTSDLHGLELCCFKELLNKAGFGAREDDFLYILGDVIDRGDGGVDILRWLLSQDNTELLLGNHEQMLIGCEWIFDTVTDDSIKDITLQKTGMLTSWIKNGAEPTLNALKALSTTAPETLCDIIDMLKDAPLYCGVSTGGRDFILTHAGLGGFKARKKLSEYSERELLWHRPTLDEKYFKDITVVFGHTPTECYGTQYAGRILHTDSWIDIDCGKNTAVLCLDTMEEFYLD